MPIFSLPGPYGCGTLGEEARAFVDRLSEGGFGWWQTLPLCLPGAGNSPYMSYAASSLNYAFVDPDTLYEEGLLRREELIGARQSQPYLCEHARLGEERYALLCRAASRVHDRNPVYEFLHRHPSVAEFCRFMALREQNRNLPFRAWQETLPEEERVYRWGFTQYEFLRQWDALHAYAATHGVHIMGDMPIYVSYESADVREHPHLFLLRKDGTPAAVAGVPPDCFSEDGQLWGNPLYDWAAMAEEGYAWWTDRMAFAGRMFDGVRIDHFRAFSSYYRIPAHAKTAREGEWVPGPGLALTDRLAKAVPHCQIVAEDLGGNTEEVRRLLQESGFPGMRVFQFAFEEDGDNPHLPHNYAYNCVAYTGTHDNNTLLGYLTEIAPDRRTRLFQYCGYTGEDLRAGIRFVIRALLSSHAGLCIFPVQDLLGYGADTRINRPGTAEGNWQVRLTAEQLSSVDWKGYARENALYFRTPAGSAADTAREPVTGA